MSILSGIGQTPSIFGIGSQTLSQVLTTGNNAGVSDIDMNAQDITNCGTITATTFVGALTGNASTATSATTATTATTATSATTATTATTATSATTATTATNIAGGAGGSIPYQSGSGTTALLANGTAGQVLTCNGASAPTWTTPSSVVTLTGGSITYTTPAIVTFTFVNTSPAFIPVTSNTMYSLTFVFNWSSTSTTADWGWSQYPLIQINLSPTAIPSSPQILRYNFSPFQPTNDAVAINFLYTASLVFNSGASNNYITFLELVGNFLNSDGSNAMTVTATAYLTPL